MKKRRAVAKFLVLFFGFTLADYFAKWITTLGNVTTTVLTRVIAFFCSFVVVGVMVFVFDKLWPEKAKDTEAKNKTEENDK